MRLSRRRFLAYATQQERFRRAHVAEDPQTDHPLQARIDAHGTTEIRIDHARWGKELRGHSLFVIAHAADGGILRRRIDAVDRNPAVLIDTVAGRACGNAGVERIEACTKLTFSLGARANAGWVKLATPLPGLFVLDRVGWQTVGLAAS